MTIDEAPNFNGVYPGSGERIGPAWRAMWAVMSDGQWHQRAEVISAGVAAGPIEARTAENLILTASRVGVVDRQIRRCADGRKRGWHRRPKA